MALSAPALTPSSEAGAYPPSHTARRQSLYAPLNLARCFNCEGGVTAEPCGECANCRDVDAGCFPDLLEVDAASRTRVRGHPGIVGQGGLRAEPGALPRLFDRRGPYALGPQLQCPVENAGGDFRAPLFM